MKQGGASIRRRGLELGWSLPSRGPLARVDVLTRLARAADALGYSVVTISDHIVLPTRSSEPYPYDKTGAFPGGSQQVYLEPIPLAAWLLAATRRVRVAISVLVVPYRNPVVTAKQLATIDALSGGRLIVGAGVGWWREEFEALAAPPFAERGAVTDEYLRLMKTLWTEDAPRFEGKYYRVGDVTMLPHPVQKPHPPIWVGGHTEPALRRTAELGDAWHPIGLRGPAGLAPDELGREDGADPHARPPGRTGPGVDRGRLQGSARPLAGPGEAGVEAPRPLSGPPDKVIADLRAYQAAGVDTVIFDFPKPDPGAMVALMRRVAREVRPRSRPSRQVARPMTATDTFAAEGRVARLATVDEAGYPHVVPVCYATNGHAYYSPLDAKPKKNPVSRLKRVRNIRANPRVALLIDHYEEDWAHLRFVMVQGRAELLDGGTEWQAARILLEAKYPQYRSLPLPPEAPVIKIVPEHVVRWSPGS